MEELGQGIHPRRIEVGCLKYRLLSESSS
jgi:hypothetical protein